MHSAPQEAAEILVADSVTTLQARHRGAVLVAGSHGGVIAGYLAAKAGVRAVLLNDAGVGMDEAGIAALSYLSGLGMAAAAVAHTSARIGDGADMLERGRVSAANSVARSLGVETGQACADAADLLRAAPMPGKPPPEYTEARFPLRQAPGAPSVWGLDSISLAAPEDAGRILIAGSHGGLLGGRAESALKVDALAALFNDAGGGIDGAGTTRLPALDGRGIAAAAVDCASARIGDARSSWETGVLTRVNRTAAAVGAAPGHSTRQFADRVIRRHRKGA